MCGFGGSSAVAPSRNRNANRITTHLAATKSSPMLMVVQLPVKQVTIYVTILKRYDHRMTESLLRANKWFVVGAYFWPIGAWSGTVVWMKSKQVDTRCQFRKCTITDDNKLCTSNVQHSQQYILLSDPQREPKHIRSTDKRNTLWCCDELICMARAYLQ